MSTINQKGSRGLDFLNRLRAKQLGGAKTQTTATASQLATPETRQLEKSDLIGTPKTIEPLNELPPVNLTPAKADGLPPAKGVLQGLWGHIGDFIKGRTSTRETNRARQLVKEIGSHAPRLAKMTDSELRGQTDVLRKHIADATQKERAALEVATAQIAKADPADRQPAVLKATRARAALTKAERKVMDKLLPEAFATVREATRRATGMFQYDVQVMAGVLMHNGMLAEMYTGEGKTLAATMPAYLNALAGHGFHVVTVNDYLAKRDAEEMGDVYRFLGMSVGVLQNNSQQFMIDPHTPGEAEDAATPKETTRKEAYQADITYGTASEFSFDYLRDNGVRDVNQRVQRPLYGVLLDEIDSLLIDEARTPHIIAGQGSDPDKEATINAKNLIDTLDWKTDVEWNLEEHWAHLTDAGQQKLEKALGIDSLYSDDGINHLYYLDNALKAKFLLRADEHYTVIGGEVRTVGHSGHAMIGRRFTRGLHQAIEAKEGVDIRPENVTAASVTMRDYVGMYQKAGGMTGTALSARDVVQQVYNLDVARVPTRKELIRVDHPDRVFKTHDEKLAAFLDDVEKAHKTGRPILVGCEYTVTAEKLGALLAERGLPVNVLGAKSDSEEATIIANAGRVGAITVATTRGGRGVDVKLGGNPKVIATQIAEEEGISLDEAQAKAAKLTAAEKADVLAKGGLFMMGFEHLDSRRRDDQLRGRAARQGDPGATVFYTSMDDAIFDGMESVEKIREGKSQYSDNKARALTEEALTRSENKVNDVLIQSLPYDNVATTYRQRFYGLRDTILQVPDCRHVVRDAITNAVDTAIDGYAPRLDSEQDAQELYAALGRMLPLPGGKPPPAWLEKPLSAVREDVHTLVDALLQKRDDAVGEEFARLIERDVLIKSMDSCWSDFLDELQGLRMGIGFRAYAQKDPKLEFVVESAGMFDQMMGHVRTTLAADLLQKIPKPIAKAPSSQLAEAVKNVVPKVVADVDRMPPTASLEEKRVWAEGLLSILVNAIKAHAPDVHELPPDLMDHLRYVVQAELAEPPPQTAPAAVGNALSARAADPLDNYLIKRVPQE